MVAATLLTTLLLALAIAIAAKPVLERKMPMKLPLTKRRILSNYNVMGSDLRRLNSLRKRAGIQDDSDLDSTVSSIPATFGVVHYTVSIGVGNPPTNYTLVLDSGSSNTWVGHKKDYVQTSTSIQTNNRVHVSYGSCILIGNEFTDQVTIGSLVIINQSIGVDPPNSDKSHCYIDQADGILGIGPVDLTSGTLFDDNNIQSKTTIPTVTDNLSGSGAIPQNSVAVYFMPGDEDNLINGEVSWGGTDASKFIGDIIYTPITTNPIASAYWGIDASAVTYDSDASGSPLGGLSNFTCIVDTGTTQLLLASEAFNAYKDAIGAVLDDENTGLLSINPDQFQKLLNLTFTISGSNFVLTPDAQVLSRSLNTLMGGDPNLIYLIIGELQLSIPGVRAILGLAFLERFYSVFDTDNHRVGLAPTPSTYSISNSN